MTATARSFDYASFIPIRPGRHFIKINFEIETSKISGKS